MIHSTPRWRMTGMTDTDARSTTDLTDDEFLARVLDGSEPRDHLANVRVAWTMVRHHGYDAGRAETEAIIRRRAERDGGTWDRETTHRWFAKVAGLAGADAADFADFVREHGDVLLRRDVTAGR